MKNEVVNSEDADLMQIRKITLADGRYMIFYEFDESLSNSSLETDKKPKSQLEATEEKNV
jgi:hypothetical protein